MTTAATVPPRSPVAPTRCLDVSPLAVIPPALEAALFEFGLLYAFRTQASARRLDQVRRVMQAADGKQHDRIADVLDEIATYTTS